MSVLFYLLLDWFKALLSEHSRAAKRAQSVAWEEDREFFYYAFTHFCLFKVVLEPSSEHGLLPRRRRESARKTKRRGCCGRRTRMWAGSTQPHQRTPC